MCCPRNSELARNSEEQRGSINDEQQGDPDKNPEVHHCQAGTV